MVEQTVNEHPFRSFCVGLLVAWALLCLERGWLSYRDEVGELRYVKWLESLPVVETKW
jgi:hypothetical protein